MPQDDEESVRWYRIASDNGHSVATVNLGYMIKEGWGVQQDSAEAVRLFSIAVEKRNMYGYYELSRMYAAGEGVPQNSEETVRLCRHSADMGFVHARAMLAKMYHNGEHTQQSFEEAMIWYRLAAEAGDKEAQNSWDKLYEESHREYEILDVPELSPLKRKDRKMHKQAKEAEDAMQHGNYAKAKYYYDRALTPLKSQPTEAMSQVNKAAWVNYATACLMLRYYDEAERVYKICFDLGIHKEYVNRQIERTAVRRSLQLIPEVSCNDETIRSILLSILPCYPHVQKKIFAHLIKSEKEYEDFCLNEAEFGRVIERGKSAAFVCMHKPEKYVIVFSKNSLKKYRKTPHTLIETVAHELAHCAIDSGMGVDEICYHFTADKKKRVNATIDKRKYYVSNGVDICDNEYLTDAALISRGFAYVGGLNASCFVFSNGYIPSRLFNKWWARNYCLFSR